MSKRSILAVIDVGSNSLSMRIAELGPGSRVSVLEQLQGSLALGEDSYANGIIQEASIQEACRILGRFRNKLKEYRIEPSAVVATSAIREAENRDYVLNRIYQTCGFRIQILDDSMECWYRLLALDNQLGPCLKKLSEAGGSGGLVSDEAEKCAAGEKTPGSNGGPGASFLTKPLQILDIGAGSVHIYYVRRQRFVENVTILVGSLRMAGVLEQHRLRSRKPMETFSTLLAERMHAGRCHEASMNRCERLVVLGEEGRCFRRIAGLKRGESEMDQGRFHHVLERLNEVSAAQLTLDYNIPPDLTDRLLPAAMTVQAQLRENGAGRIYFPDVDLCLGILDDLAIRTGRAAISDFITSIPFDQARAFARRMGADEAHLDRIDGYVRRLFAALRKRFGHERRQELYLRLAGQLAGVGQAIRLSRYGEVSFEMIQALELLGLSQKERERVAYIAAFASRNARPLRSEMTNLPGVYRQEIISLSAVLRVAQALDVSGRAELSLRHVHVQEETIVLEAASGSGERCELERLTLPDAARLFEDVYGLRVKLKI